MNEKNEKQREMLDGHINEPSAAQQEMAAEQRRASRLGLPDRAPLFVIDKPEEIDSVVAQRLTGT